MKTFRSLLPACLLSLFVLTGQPSKAQNTYPGPVEYLNDVSKTLDRVQADLWDYMNAVSHNKSARKIEKRRLEIVETIKNAKQYIFKMPDYKGDRSLHDSAYSYLKISYDVMTEDYSKLADLEDAADQSYDAMEVYIRAKKVAYEKQDISIQMLQNAVKAFAARNNITLNETRKAITVKLDQAGKVYDYYNTIYLLFFRSFKQEVYVMDALNKNDIPGLKQNSELLNKFAKEGLQKLGSIRIFAGDATLKGACRESLQFFKNESETRMPVIISFLEKKEAFAKVKKIMDTKPAAQRTQEDIIAYNTAVKDFNASLAVFNAAIQKINEDRAKFLTRWNESVNTFIDIHVPKN